MATNLYLSPIGNGAQFFTAGGLPLNGGFLNTYAAGTSTPLATYTTPVGNIANATSIQLGVDGRPPNEIWFTQGNAYKFILTDSLLNIIGTYDNLSGINDPTANTATSEWIPVVVTPVFVTATQFTMAGNQLLSFAVNRRVQVIVSAGTLYGVVSSSSFATNITTVNVTLDSGALDSGLSQVNVGILNSDNSSIPYIKDSDFRISGSADKTKRIAFEVDGLTTATTRTLTVQDKDITIAGLADVSTVVGTMRNGKMSVTAASATATFTADEVVVETALGGTYARLSSYSQAINLGTTGAGGMDTGAAPATGFVSLYAIAKADGTKNILACNVTTSSASIYGGANMPSGYTYSALIGIWPTNGSSQFIPGYITSPNERKFNYQTYSSVFTATADKSTLTSQSISTAVPSGAKTASVLLGTATISTNYKCAAAADGTGTGGKVAAAAATSTTASLIGGTVVLTGQFVLPDIPIITAQTVFVASISGASTNAMYVSDYTW